MALDTVAYKGDNLQPGIRVVHLELTGAGAAAPTFPASADNDNRLIPASGISRTGAGDYTITLSQSGRKLSHATACLLSPVTGTSIWLGTATLSSGTVRVKLFGAAGAVDIAASDVVSLCLVFKNSGA